ncbi:MAG: PqqD family protein [Phycisphaeraceae bacterium]
MKRRQGFSVDQFLDAMPTANAAIREQAVGDDRVVLVAPLKKRWFNGPPVTWFVPMKRERRVGLDALGTEVWRLCDGRHTTEQIMDLFAQRHRIHFHEARVCVSQFLRMLTERGMVAMVGLHSRESQTDRTP